MHDNWQVTSYGEQSNCAYIDTQYSQAFHIWQTMHGYLHFFRAPQGQARPRVRVMVIDTGVAVSQTDVQKRHFKNLTGQGALNWLRGKPNDLEAEDPDSDSHGTMIASIIASDNRGGDLHNGLASSFLVDSSNRSFLELQVLQILVPATPTLRQKTATLNSILRGITTYGRDADIVNLSYYVHPRAPDIATWVSRMRKAVRLVPDTLFVISAPHFTAGPFNATNAWSSMDEPNVIGVVGTQHCLPTDLSVFYSLPGGGFNPGSSWWDVSVPASDRRFLPSAPSESVPVINKQGDRVSAYGTSVAAPFVTSLAAIVKYIRPTWKAPELKYHLAGNPISSFFFQSRDGQNKDAEGNDLWLYGFITFPNAINAAILDLTFGTPHDPIASFLLDQPVTPGQYGAGNTKGAYTLPSPDLATAIMTRLCDTGALILLDNAGGGLYYAPWDERVTNFVSGWVDVEPDGFSIHVWLGPELMLGLWFPGWPMVPNSGFSVALPSSECDYVNEHLDIKYCTGFVGEITLGKCEVNLYHNMFVAPWGGSVEGEITGTFSLQDKDGVDFQSRIVDKAVFRLWANFSGCAAEEECRMRLESMCSGGRKLVRD